MFQQPEDPRIARYDHFICHVTATRPSQDIGPAWIDRVHRSKGFRNGTGYHVLVKLNGAIYAADDGHLMRPFEMAGAHVGGCGPEWNKRSFALVLEGGLDQKTGQPADTRTEAQNAGMFNVIRQFIDAHPRPHTLKFLGHRDLIKQVGAAPKACPCFDFPEWYASNRHALHSWREDVFDRTPMNIDTQHEVQKGDSLWKIAKQYHTTVERISLTNNLASSIIYPGQILEIS